MTGPYCSCCLHVIRAGDDGPRRVPAAYRWVTKAGNEVLQCTSDCCHWRETAAWDTSLLPERIYSVQVPRQEPLSSAGDLP